MHGQSRSAHRLLQSSESGCVRFVRRQRRVCATLLVDERLHAEVKAVNAGSFWGQQTKRKEEAMTLLLLRSSLRSIGLLTARR
jgi:hypothetical protein